MLTLPDKKNNKEIKKQVAELYRLDEQFKVIKRDYDKAKEKLTTAIKNYCFCTKDASDGFQFFAHSKADDRDKKIVVKKIEPTTIAWDADKLEHLLSKEVRESVIKKTYTINDMSALVVYLKKCGVDAKRFKNFIDVEKSVDVAELEQLDALGKVNRDDIADCYTVSKKSSYLKITVSDEE